MTVQMNLKWKSKDEINSQWIKDYLMIFHDQDNNLQVHTNIKDLGRLVGLAEILRGLVAKSYGGQTDESYWTKGTQG